MDVIIFSGQSNMQGQSETLSEHDIVKDAYEYKWLTDELVPLQNPVGENITYSMDQGYEVTPETRIPLWLKEHVLVSPKPRCHKASGLFSKILTILRL